MRWATERDAMRVGARRNKNEILGLTNARLVKEKHLNGMKYSGEIGLAQGISTNAANGEFIIVLRADGRIVAMSDEVEYHLGKSMVNSIIPFRLGEKHVCLVAFTLHAMRQHFRMSRSSRRAKVASRAELLGGGRASRAWSRVYLSFAERKTAQSCP